MKRVSEGVEGKKSDNEGASEGVRKGTVGFD